MEEKLESIKQFADKAHGEQLRKYSPERYIVHPERVMNTVRNYSEHISVLSAALLHDVLEDTPVTSDEIREFLIPLIGYENALKAVGMVIELTDVYIKKDYPHLSRYKRKALEVKRMSKISADAQTVKYADILDNTPDITVNDPDFADRYLKECLDLLRVMKEGNAELHKKTIDVVKDCRKELHTSKRS